MKHLHHLSCVWMALIVAACVGLAPTSSHANTKIPVLVGSVDLSGAPSDVAYNPTNNRVYVALTYDSKLSVVDPITKTAQDVTLDFKPLRLAVDAANNGLFIIDDAARIHKFDCATNTAGAVAAKVGGVYNFSSIAYNPKTDRLYASSYGKRGNVNVFRASTLAFITSIAVGTAFNPVPEDIAINRSTNRIYVCLKREAKVAVINGVTNTVTKLIPVAASPWGITVNPSLNRVYVACADAGVSIIKDKWLLATTVVQRASGGAASPYDIVADGSSNRVFTGDIGVLTAYSGKQLGSVYFHQNTRGMDIDTASDTLFVADYASPSRLVMFSTGPSVKGHLIRGRVYQWVQDVNHPMRTIKRGLPNIPLWLYNNANLHRGALTNSDGFYTFAVPDGSYSLTPFPPSVYRSGRFDPFQTYHTISGKDVMQNFATYRIAGRLIDARGAPLAGAIVRLVHTDELETRTDTKGRYVFDIIGRATCTVTPVLPDGQSGAFSPANATVDLPTSGLPGVSPNGKAFFQLRASSAQSGSPSTKSF